MNADPRDDFSVFAGREHMFFGLDAPFRLIREEIERGLQRQVPGTEVDAIECDAEPKFLTLGRRVEGDEGKMIVTHFAVCVHAQLEVSAGDYRERMPLTLTMCFGDIDTRGEERMHMSMALHRDAALAFADDEFAATFMAFRHER